MSFRDFISNRWYRQRLFSAFDRWQRINPPPNPSRRQIDRLVKQLLDPQRAREAHRVLSMIGAAIVPSLTTALHDRRFHLADWESFSASPPLQAVLELLAPHAPEQVISSAAPLVDSPDSDVRTAIAKPLASTGRQEALPALERLLQDEEGYVRSSVNHGVVEALTEGRLSPEFRDRIYGLLLGQCDQDWGEAGNRSASTVIALDKDRAARNFSSGQWLTTENRSVDRILRACNQADIHLPATRLRQLLDETLPKSASAQSSRSRRVASATLEALALSTGEDMRSVLQLALTHEHTQIQEAAANGLARLAGLKDPIRFVVDRQTEVGFHGLSPAQRVVYGGFEFDMEVSNGGILQFLGNSSGDHAVELLEALRELNHPASSDALTEAIRLIGPPAREPDRELRLEAIEGRFEELQKAFEPLESAIFNATPTLRQAMLLYAIEHAAEFLSTS